MRLPEQYGFLLSNYSISFADQCELVSHTKSLYEQGLIRGSAYTTKGYQGPNFVYSLGMRYAMQNGEQANSSLVNRFNTTLDWHWNDAWDLTMPLIPTVRRIVDPILPLYKQLTRVVILLQCIGEELPLHNDYFPQWEAEHKANHNMAIKFPLTDKLGNNGLPVIKHDNQVFNYSVGSNAFLLNEVDLEHGSQPVQHTRGVLFLDGVLDMERVLEQPRAPIPLLQASLPTSNALANKKSNATL